MISNKRTLNKKGLYIPPDSNFVLSEGTEVTCQGQRCVKENSQETKSI